MATGAGAGVGARTAGAGVTTGGGATGVTATGGAITGAAATGVGCGAGLGTVLGADTTVPGSPTMWAIICVDISRNA